MNTKQVEATISAPYRGYGEAMDALGGIVDSIVNVDRDIARAMARRAVLIDKAKLRMDSITVPSRADSPVGWSAAERARRLLGAELATAMRLPEGTVHQLIAESVALVHDLPDTLSALGEGAMSYRHAQRIVDHAESLPPESRHQFELSVLATARTSTAAQLDRRARIVRERMHPDSVAKRHTLARSDRRVSLEHARDGMAWLSALLPASEATACHDRLTSLAQDAAAADSADPGHGAYGADDVVDGAPDDRTEAQRRADALVDLLIGGVTQNGLGRGVRASVSITVPVLTLLGQSEEPGYLAGHGPLDAETARRLAGTASSWTRILTHPETGAVLSVGRTSYTVPPDLRRWLVLRDETCRFPGCNRSAGRCDVDHTEDWIDGGDTAHDNLAHLCRAHHRLKHETDWMIVHEGDGTIRWISPLGRTYVTEPALSIAS